MYRHYHGLRSCESFIAVLGVATNDVAILLSRALRAAGMLARVIGFVGLQDECRSSLFLIILDLNLEPVPALRNGSHQ